MKVRRSRVGLAICAPLLLAALSADVPGGGDSPAPTPAPAPCSAPEYRQFDFWVGTWDVMEEGKLAGTNRIDSILGGCVLHENWKGSTGMAGTSLNAYDAPADRWRQSWADSNGSVLLLEGKFQNGTMVLEGTRPAKGGEARHRISWQRIGGDPNRVRQLWEVSRDGGKSWSNVFDGTYVRTGPGRQPPG